MPTINHKLNNLSQDELMKYRELYLRGYRDWKEWGFQLKGLNSRLAMNLQVDQQQSVDWRIAYVKAHFTELEVITQLEAYVATHKMDSARWDGIELFDCRFGRDYPKCFKAIVGPKQWRKISEKARMNKIRETQTNYYGGLGLASKSSLQKSLQTRVEKAQGSDQYRNQVMSEYERAAYAVLVHCFGRDDVVYQYGLTNGDKRYPYNCDFYIKSLDLFIELNAHWSHGNHWFDPTNPHDQQRLSQLKTHRTKAYRQAVDIWTQVDLEKRAVAKKHQLKYLVFWDGKSERIDGELIPRLRDFFLWVHKYQTDYAKFVTDFPDNTY